MKQENKLILDKIAQAIFDKKGMNILVLDVKNTSTITDYIVIAEGNVARHLSAISNEVQKSLKELGETPIHVEGKQEGEWIVLDYLNMIIHLFLPALREIYQLERLWSDGEVVDVEINVGAMHE